MTLLAKIFPDTETNTVDIVSESLKDLKHNVYGFEVDSGKKDMAAGKIAINFAWSGDAAYTLDTADEYSDGAQLYYAVPKEGSNIWFDAWVMPKGANKELAQFFVNFISSPECAISNMDYIGYVSVIAGSEVFAYVKKNYEEADGKLSSDLSYFFGSGEYKINYGNPYGKFAAQYPDKDVIGRCVVMNYFPEEANKRINDMWADVKIG